MPVRHSVVEQYPGVAGDQSRPVPHLNTLQLADRVAPTVHDAEVRRIRTGGPGRCERVVRYAAPIRVMNFAVAPVFLRAIRGALHVCPGVAFACLRFGQCLFKVDQPSALGRVIFVQHAFDRHIDEFRVGGIGFAVCKRQFLALGHRVDSIRGEISEALRVEVFE